MSHKLTVLPHLIKHTPKGLIPKHGSIKVFAFDLDHTIIQPCNGLRFSRTAYDWQFMEYGDATTLENLIQIVKNDPTAHVVIFSNQGGVIALPPDSKSCTKYVAKIDLILKAISLTYQGEELLQKLWIYASPKAPARTKNCAMFEQMRKPCIGMMEQFQQDIAAPIDLQYYCGDAAGRPTDFSDSDLLFAQNLHTQFRLPEDVFIT
ncbi:TPP1 (YMR156C) [Zygosaccharomyces parabailii]|uniref:BN860_04126g1_1 n=1 Tax=Zygosaccharomyces bailii (strain CLIB 213 / ATCC 58445 / CBS 680 / BCRC 21525 / NBRC 1098 / NCYC 1416 / NRRL Y-2227) TaxID=1333698 RepID=A0A8J2T3B6_ZYGB2|nr:TPP1 (YMR156C) [Zygosaccharomyces parabailii]CDF87337.1 BN860_04126g1_1 [Zygosaccharomyces bailii CLIB 213]SJM84939.1 related to Polynucleotide 3'-phosphatase [Zygosaccharomyces bailii]